MRRHKCHRTAALVLLPLMAVGLLLTAGCATSRHPWSPTIHSQPEEEFLLAPGDELEISFLGAPDLDVKQVIRRDGKISLRMLGEVQAAGKPPKQLQDEVSALYAPQLQIKETSVVVSSMAPVFVGGAVKAPGQFQVARPVTALEAIMQAGGFNEYEAELRNVIVIRHREGKRFGYSLDFKKTLTGNPAPVFYLRPYDIVYVPRTPITKVNQWIDQHINRMLPRLGVGVTSGGDVTFSR